MEESMADDDFIIEGGDTGSNRRPFFIAAATLTTIFILASVCSLLFLFSNRTASNPEATAIAATNAVILITNEAVTAAIDATNIALSQPADVPESEPTVAPTSTATSVPATTAPTKTAVVEQPPKDTATPNLSGTSAVEQLAVTEETEEGATNSEDSTPTPIAASTSSASNDADALPQTGFETWGTLVVGLLLAAVLIAARRLRRSA